MAVAHSEVEMGGMGQCGTNGPAQIGTGYIRVGRKNRQKENWATEDLMVTSRRKLQHGLDTHGIHRNIVTKFADTSSRWLATPMYFVNGSCSLQDRRESLFHVLKCECETSRNNHLVQKQFIN